jgi:ubiquinone/menaquinone biosynthesis C-methylase UbiE
MMTPRSEEDRARELYAQRDADAAWAARWSPENPTARFTQEQRLAAIRALLPGLERRFGPPDGWRVLEVGVGGGGLLPWLRDAVGVPEARLAGIDLSPDRVVRAAQSLPSADIRAGSAAELPWPDASFDVVVASTLFSSVLDPTLRAAIARESLRVLRPGGVVMWYDMRSDFLLAGLFRRLAHPAEDWLSRREVAALFPGCTLELRPATLFLPLARPLVRVSPALARAAERAMPFFRGHWLGLIVKPS